MLNLYQLSDQMNQMSVDLTAQRGESYRVLEMAKETVVLAQKGILGYLKLFREKQNQFPFNPGLPEDENVFTPLPPPPITSAFSVVATDGSQVAPTHHEIALCYLLNIGKIIYTYGTGDPVIQESQPFLFHKKEDILWNGNLISEDILAMRRTLFEAYALQELGKRAKERGYPLLCMTDGPLVHWPWQTFPEEVQKEAFGHYIRVLDLFLENQIPICGYISFSRSVDMLNFLRIPLCPYRDLECSKHCPTKHACDPLSSLRDTQVVEGILREGERTGIFWNTNLPLMDRYQQHTIGFFYLHGGGEVAKVEIPQWVARNPTLLSLTHTVVYDQIQKGRGYPITLSEAHNQAVVGSTERKHFFMMLEKNMVQQGLRVTISGKERRKRQGIA